MEFFKKLFGNKQSDNDSNSNGDLPKQNNSDPIQRAKNLLPKWRAAVAQDDAAKYDIARRQYLELINVFPGLLSAYNNLAVLDIFEGNITSAKEYAEKATQYSYANGQTTLGVIHVRQGNLAEAIVAFEKGGGTKEALTNLCGACAELGRYDEAIVAGESALKLDKKDPPTYANLIRAYGKAGLPQKAEALTAEAISHVSAQSLRPDLMIGRDSMLVLADTEGHLLVHIDKNGGLFTITIV
jgi:pentatricopeptide repeat protein